MISHSKKFIFLHIPKTGGTSIYSALHNYGTMLYKERNEQSIYYKHAFAKDLKLMFGDEFDNYYKFTFVRNPFDWIVSNYFFNRGLHQPYTRPLGIQHHGRIPPEYEDMVFKEWLFWWSEKFNPLQSRMIVDSQSKPLVNDIYYFENIEADFKRLCKKMNVWIWPRRLKHTNKTSSKNAKDFRLMYDDESIELVNNKFNQDFELFGYPKGLPGKLAKII